MTRAHVTLLGPCFKTGQVDSYHYTTDYGPHIVLVRKPVERIRVIIRPAHTGNVTTKLGHADQL
jgi:hypothetical protein